MRHGGWVARGMQITEEVKQSKGQERREDADEDKRDGK
jgi:hypothetical protein